MKIITVIEFNILKMNTFPFEFKLNLFDFHKPLNKNQIKHANQIKEYFESPKFYIENFVFYNGDFDKIKTTYNPLPSTMDMIELLKQTKNELNEYFNEKKYNGYEVINNLLELVIKEIIFDYEKNLNTEHKYLDVEIEDNKADMEEIFKLEKEHAIYQEIIKNSSGIRKQFQKLYEKRNKACDEIKEKDYRRYISGGMCDYIFFARVFHICKFLAARKISLKSWLDGDKETKEL